MNLRSSIAVTAAMLVAHPTAAQDHHFEADRVVTVRENFVAYEVLSQLPRVMDDPRFLLTGECEPLSAGCRVRIYARSGPYVCEALFWRPDLGLILIPQGRVLIIDAQHVTKAQALHFGSLRDNMTCRRKRANCHTARRSQRHFAYPKNG
jgi:hypothetical protein